MCVRISTNIHSQTQLHAQTHMHMHIHTHNHVFIVTYTHTHTLTRTQVDYTQTIVHGMHCMRLYNYISMNLSFINLYHNSIG